MNNPVLCAGVGMLSVVTNGRLLMDGQWTERVYLPQKWCDCCQPLNACVSTDAEIRLKAICSLLGFYATYRHSGTSYRSRLQGRSTPRRPSSLENGTDRFSRNVGNQLPLYAA